MGSLGSDKIRRLDDDDAIIGEVVPSLFGGGKNMFYHDEANLSRFMRKYAY